MKHNIAEEQRYDDLLRQVNLNMAWSNCYVEYGKKQHSNWTKWVANFIRENGLWPEGLL